MSAEEERGGRTDGLLRHDAKMSVKPIQSDFLSMKHLLLFLYDNLLSS